MTEYNLDSHLVWRDSDYLIGYGSVVGRAHLFLRYGKDWGDSL